MSLNDMLKDKVIIANYLEKYKKKGLLNEDFAVWIKAFKLIESREMVIIIIHRKKRSIFEIDTGNKHRYLTRQKQSKINSSKIK